VERRAYPSVQLSACMLASFLIYIVSRRLPFSSDSVAFSCSSQVSVDGTVVLLQLEDTVADEVYDAMISVSLRTAQGVLLVSLLVASKRLRRSPWQLYSITSRPSFESLPRFIERCLRAQDSETVRGLVGVF
jgi:hypothetical protein